jgi:hypothetical protein
MRSFLKLGLLSILFSLFFLTAPEARADGSMEMWEYIPIDGFGFSFCFQAQCKDVVSARIVFVGPDGYLISYTDDVCIDTTYMAKCECTWDDANHRWNTKGTCFAIW